MDTSLLSLYLKLNILLAAVLLLWLAIRSLARRLGFESSHALQLRIARLLFIGLLCMAGVALCAYGWLTEFATSVADGVTVVAGIDANLGRNIEVAAVGFDLRSIVLLLLVFGFAAQAAWLALQATRLRRIVNGAAEWRRLGGVYLLVSTTVATPFSTRALGRKHVVLPMSLLQSPRNLRFAVKHELQHVRNGDLGWVILLEAVKALCFWNPAAWLWHNEFDCLQEFACDEALVSKPHVTPQAYGGCLLDVASAHSRHAILAASNMVPKFSWWQNTQSQLKRRITMLTTVRSTRFKILKSLVYALLAGLGFMQSALVVFAAEAAPPTSIWFGVDRVNPEYPQEALAGSLEGWVFVDYRVDDKGAVYDVKVLDHGVCERGQDLNDYCAPGDMFDSSTIAAVSKWRYDKTLPQLARQPRGRTVIHFQLDDDDK